MDPFEGMDASSPWVMLQKSDGGYCRDLKDSGVSRRMVRWVVMTSNPSRIAIHARAPMALGVTPLAPTCVRGAIRGARQEIGWK